MIRACLARRVHRDGAPLRPRDAGGSPFEQVSWGPRRVIATDAVLSQAPACFDLGSSACANLLAQRARICGAMKRSAWNYPRPMGAAGLTFNLPPPNIPRNFFSNATRSATSRLIR